MHFALTLEDIAHPVYLKERCATSLGKASAQVGNLVVHAKVTFLPQHTQGCKKLLLRTDLLMLCYRYYTVAQCQPPLYFFLVADSQYRVGATEGCKISRCTPCLAVCYNTLNAKQLCSFYGITCQKLRYVAIVAHAKVKVMVEHFIKDMGIALEEAEKMELSLPSLALTKQLYLAIKAEGHGRKGTQVLVKALEALSGKEIL